MLNTRESAPPSLGLPADAPKGAKTAAIAFSVGGFIFNLVVLGLVVDTLTNLLERWKRLHQHVIANRHTVLLGWPD